MKQFLDRLQLGLRFRFFVVGLFLIGSLLALFVAKGATITRAQNPAVVHTLATFSATQNEHAENVAVASDGTIYVTLHNAAAVWVRQPDGTTLRIPFPKPANLITRVNGIVITGEQEAVVAVLSQDASIAGVWRINDDHSIERIVSLPSNASPNGMARDSAGNLYIADDLLGCIWRVVPGSSTAEVWSQSVLLNRNTASGVVPYGADGIKVFKGVLFVSNPSQSTIVRIPICSNGAAGSPEVQWSGPAFSNSDDFAFDVQGDLYVANILDQTITRVDQEGHVSTFLEQSDGLNYPTAVAFGRQGADKLNLYITNGAFNPQYPEGSLQQTTVDVPGYVVH